MATLSELQAELTDLKAARAKAITAQSYKDVAGNALTRGDLGVINQMIAELEMRIAIINGGGVLTHGHAVFRGTR